MYQGEGRSPSKETPVEAARKSNRAGKGRNPRLEREDEEVEIPKKERITCVYFDF